MSVMASLGLTMNPEALEAFARLWISWVEVTVVLVVVWWQDPI